MFFNRIPIGSLRIRDLNAMHLGKQFLAAIFSTIVYCARSLLLLVSCARIHVLIFMIHLAGFVSFHVVAVGLS